MGSNPNRYQKTTAQEVSNLLSDKSNWQPCTEDSQCASNWCGCNGGSTMLCLPNTGYPKDCTIETPPSSPPCISDCSCAANTCTGQTCSDGCGGTCSGTKTCTVTNPGLANWSACSSNSQCSSNWCGCNGSSTMLCLPNSNYPKTCVSACQPSCSCAANTCTGQTCSDGCGGTCQGTKNCQISDSNLPYSVPVLSISYIPTSGNDLIDLNITGDLFGKSTVSGLEEYIQQVTNAGIYALNEGSKYHRYKDSSAKPSLNYSIFEHKEVLQAIPRGFLLDSISQTYRPDYQGILNGLNICDYVDNQGVKEVWIWGYHYGQIVPVESNQSMGTNSRAVWNHGSYGDASNSEQTDDLPICANSYTLFNFNYSRSTSENVEDHTHQIERIMPFVNSNIWNNLFVGSQGNTASYYRCGWTHYPPNVMNYGSGHDYDWQNQTTVSSDCANWTPDGSGEKNNVNCSTWKTYYRDPMAPNGYDGVCADDGGSSFKVWWMQNIPGYNNGIVYNGQYMKNWWVFIGDFDNAIKDRTFLSGNSAASNNTSQKSTSNFGSGLGGQILDNSKVILTLSNLPGSNYSATTSIENIGEMTDLITDLVNSGIISLDSNLSETEKNNKIQQISETVFAMGTGSLNTVLNNISSSFGLGGTLSEIDGLSLNDEYIVSSDAAFGSGSTALTGSGVGTSSGLATETPDTKDYSDKLSGIFKTFNIFEEGITLVDLFKKILNIAMTLAGLVALAFIIYGGYLYIMSGGSQEDNKKAMQTITQAAIGLVLVLAAWLIITTVINIFKK